MEEKNVFEKFNLFLEETKKFKIDKDKTFFEVTKYPYREKVSSNILAFYFKIDEEHNLGDLFIRALIIAINKKLNKIPKKDKSKITTLIDNNIEINELKVEPEYHTKNNKSIDLIIYNENFAIGIENKLEASLYNDLNDYANAIDKIHKNNYKIVLSIRAEQTKFGFINILYKDFFYEVKKLLKLEKTNKWCVFLEEFIETIERKEEERLMNDEFSKWYNKREYDIKLLFDKLIKAQNTACDKVNELAEKLDPVIEKYGYPSTTRYNSDRSRIGRDLCYSICNIQNVE